MTGASRGIGAAIARRLATEAAGLVITCFGSEAAAAATAMAIRADVANGAAAFLASNNASYIIGLTIDIDGGFSI